MLAREGEPGDEAREPSLFHQTVSAGLAATLSDSVNLNVCLSAGVLEEAKFFGITKAIEPLETLVRV